MTIRPLYNSEHIEVEIKNNTSKTIYFPYNDRIKGKKIVRIDAISRRAYTGTIRSYTGKTLVSATIQRRAFLVLVRNNKEIYNKIPLLYFISDENAGYRFPLSSDIDWDKSYVYYDSPSGLTAGQVFSFNIFYENKQEDQHIKLAKAFLNNSLLYNCYTWNVTVNDTTTRRYFFPDNERLTGKQILAISCEDPGTFYYSPSGGSQISSAVYHNTFLNLVDEKDRERIRNLNLSELGNYNNYLQNKILFNGMKVNWTKSYVMLPPGEALTANTVITFQVFYK